MDIHDLLNSFIDDGWEEPAKVLYSMWNDQQKAITYKELKEAIRNGSLTVSDYMAWQQDYINWLNGPYAETVERAVQFAHKALVDQYGGVLNIPSLEKIDEFISNHGGRLIREVSEGQFRAINTLVRQAMMTETLTVDELARCIRPCIGLTERQAMQTRKFYEQLREDGYSKSAAMKKQQAFAEKLHRDRAKLIAQTEMAYAANYGMDATVHQSIEDGLISPDVDKEWSTARDERVCPICGSLHGETVKEDETFSNGDELPPAHPSCRCAVKYHMKPAERPKNKEPEEPEPLPTDESDGIINTGSRAETPVEEPELPTAHTSADTEWLRDGYDSAILHGNLSALTGFDTYQEVARQVEVELVGLETFDGIKIAGYKTHFIDRVIGDYNIRREPVEISDIKKTLLSDTSGVRDRVEANGLRSRNYISESCRVTINPDTRLLVQTTPKKKGGIDVGKSIRKPEGRITGFISRRIRWLNRKKRL